MGMLQIPYHGREMAMIQGGKDARIQSRWRYSRRSGSYLQLGSAPRCSRFLPIVILAALTTVLGGCAPRLQVDLAAGSALNPGPEGESLPVLVRLYQLKDRHSFEQLELASLARDESQALGTWQAQHEVVLKPGQRRRLDLPMADEAEHLAVAALYQDTDSEQWRAVVPLPPSFLGVRPGREVMIALDRQRIRVRDQEAGAIGGWRHGVASPKQRTEH